MTIKNSRRAWQARFAHVPYLLILIAAVFYLNGALLDDYADQSHEGLFNNLRIAELREEIAGGYFPPQQLNSAFAGAGHAFFVFYPPLSALITLLFVYPTGKVILAVNSSLFLSVLVSGFTMYRLGYFLSRRRLAALAAALCYTAASYRLVDTHLRGALAESWTFAWYPLALQGAFFVIRRKSFSILLPLSVAAMILTHTVTGLFFSIILVMLVPFFLMKDWRTLTIYAASGLLGIGLSAFYLIPMAKWFPMVLASDPFFMLSGWTRLVHERVPFGELFFHTRRAASGDEYDFRITCSFVGAMVVAMCAAASPRSGGAGTARMAWVLALCWCFYFIFAWHPDWMQFLPEQATFLQFPWRLVGMLVFVQSVAIAWAAKFLHGWKYEKLIFCTIAAAALATSSAHLRFRNYDMSVSERDLTKEGRAADEHSLIGYTVLGEYAPKNFKPSIPRGTHPAFPPKLKVTNGAVKTMNFERVGVGAAQLHVVSDAPATISVPLMAYPYWRATMAGGPTPWTDQKGLITVTIPAGDTTIEFERFYPAPYMTGGIISLLSLIGVVAMGVWERRRTMMSDECRTVK